MQNFNSDLTKELVRAGRLQVNQGVPSQILPTIQPTIEVNPKLMRILNAVRGNRSVTSGTLSIMTTPTDREFYLTSIGVSYVKDATCDAVTGRFDVFVVIDGATQVLHAFPVLTTTAQSDSWFLSFPFPMKIDKGTGITMSGSFTAGNLIRTGEAIGFFVENTNA